MHAPSNNAAIVPMESQSGKRGPSEAGSAVQLGSDVVPFRNNMAHHSDGLITTRSLRHSAMIVALIVEYSVGPSQTCSNLGENSYVPAARVPE